MNNDVMPNSLARNIFAGLSTFGLGALATFFSFYTFGVVANNLVEVVEYVFNIIFSSLNLVCFFIRPDTVKSVCIIFTAYWILRLSMKTLVSTVRLGRGLYSYISSFANGVVNIICRAAGV